MKKSNKTKYNVVKIKNLKYGGIFRLIPSSRSNCNCIMKVLAHGSFVVHCTKYISCCIHKSTTSASQLTFGFDTDVIEINEKANPS
jgi:hypothetical protein